MPLYEIKDVEEVAECDEEKFDTIEIYYDELLGQTDKAVLVKIDGEDMFIPKTHICSVDKKHKQIMITEWIATEKGLV